MKFSDKPVLDKWGVTVYSVYTYVAGYMVTWQRGVNTWCMTVYVYVRIAGKEERSHKQASRMDYTRVGHAGFQETEGLLL